MAKGLGKEGSERWVKRLSKRGCCARKRKKKSKKEEKKTRG